VNTVWRAPDLDCVTLKVTEDFLEDGKVTGHFEKETISVKAGAPDPALFNVPASYVERSPVEIHRMLGDVYAKPLPEKYRKRLLIREQRYAASHAAHDRP